MYTLKEIFYTIQGEGMHTGRPAVFLRFAGCNPVSYTHLDVYKRQALTDV